MRLKVIQTLRDKKFLSRAMAVRNKWVHSSTFKITAALIRYLFSCMSSAAQRSSSCRTPHGVFIARDLPS